MTDSSHQFGEQLEAVGIAYGSESILRFVKTDEETELKGVELSEYESPSEEKEQFIGSDSESQRVCFDITYNDVGVEDVELLYGEDETSLGSITVVVLERLW